MNTELSQAAYDEAAHERLAEIRKITGCKIGDEALVVRSLIDIAATRRREIAEARKAILLVRDLVAEVVKVL